MNTCKGYWQGVTLLPEKIETGMPHIAILPGETDQVKGTVYDENPSNKMDVDDEKEMIIQDADEVNIFLAMYQCF